MKDCPGLGNIFKKIYSTSKMIAMLTKKASINLKTIPHNSVHITPLVPLLYLLKIILKKVLTPPLLIQQQELLLR